MKRILFLFLTFCAATINAQDVIVKRDGSTILSKVTEIGLNEVKYKKFSNQTGPIYSILKSDILSINYENGEKETFAPQLEKQETEGKQQIIEAKPATDNAEIISRYNRTYEHGDAIDVKNKKADAGLCILGVSTNSVLSTEDIVIEFRQEPYIVGEARLGYKYNIIKRFHFQIHNKTDRIIYVDLGSTFRVKKDGSAKVYYNNSQTTITKGAGTNTGVNLGAIAGAIGIGSSLATLANGISIGKGSLSSSSTVYAKQRVISIPPHGTVPIEKYHIEFVENNRVEEISEGETLLFGYSSSELPSLNYGEQYVYNEIDSPFHSDYFITYSKSADFSLAIVVKASIYMRELIGAKPYMGKYWDVSWWTDSSDPQKQIERMKERIPEYDDYTIVGVFGYAKNAFSKE